MHLPPHGGLGAKGACTVNLKCRRCGKPLGNPLTHVCVTRTDFKKRKAAAARPAPRPAPGGNAHEYTACDNDDCSRFMCKVYKEGRSDGVELGIELGRQLGFAEGYDQGFPDGIAACPREHKG